LISLTWVGVSVRIGQLGELLDIDMHNDPILEAVWLKWIVAKMIQTEGIFSVFRGE